MESGSHDVGYRIGQMFWPFIALIVVVYQAKRLMAPVARRVLFVYVGLTWFAL